MCQREENHRESHAHSQRILCVFSRVLISKAEESRQKDSRKYPRLTSAQEQLVLSLARVENHCSDIWGFPVLRSVT
jgi:uncharacterized protein (DUF2384 family)